MPDGWWFGLGRSERSRKRSMRRMGRVHHCGRVTHRTRLQKDVAESWFFPLAREK
jgi:hypothetical protein